MTGARAAFLPRLVAHLRGGGIHEIAGPCTGRVTWSATRIRLAPDVDGRIRLQMQVETRLRSGRTMSSTWNVCDWTIDDLLSLRDEAAEPEAVSTGMDDVVAGDDPVVDALSDLMRGAQIALSGILYVLDDDSVSVVDGGTLIMPDATRHPVDDWIAYRTEGGRAA